MKLNNWKPVIIEGALLDNGLDLDGLIGIEECTDYNLDSIEDSEYPQKTTKAKASKKAKKKRNNTKDDTTEIPQTPSKSGSVSQTFKVTPNKSIKKTTDLPNDLITEMTAWNIVPLSTPILKALAEVNFMYPRDIQMLTLPASILGRRDILGAAETGSGKTLAFGLPILSGILKAKESCNKDSKILYALILAPTRELAIQIKNHLDIIAKYTGIRSAVVVGGLAPEKQKRILKCGPEIVVATPGRLWELIEQGNEHLSQLSDIKYLAIDETDRMLERGHFQELEKILERVNDDNESKKQRQNFVFSATLTLTHEMPAHLLLKKKLKLKKRLNDLSPTEKLKKIIDSLGITNPKVVDITQKGKGTADKLTESRITCAVEEKDYYVYYFLKRHPGRTLIFCNSIGCVRRLTTILGLLDCEPLALHASMAQKQRLKNLDRFRERDGSILIATDVAARGLDIPAVEHVLHYQTPRTAEGYVHRSGRTARASNEGITVLLIDNSELQNYIRLCRTLGKTEDIPSFPIQEQALNAIKQRVNLAREVDKLDLQVRKATSESSWYEKAAKEMDMIIDVPSVAIDSDDARHLKKVTQIKRKQLASLLATPLFPHNISGKYPLSSANIEELNKISTTLPTASALDVMKIAIETENIRKLPKKIFQKRGNKRSTEDIDTKALKASPRKKRKINK